MTETLIKWKTYLLLFHFASTVRMLEDSGEEKRAEKIIEREDCVCVCVFLISIFK